jgi:hypothetical protein
MYNRNILIISPVDTKGSLVPRPLHMHTVTHRVKISCEDVLNQNFHVDRYIQLPFKSSPSA